MNNYISKFSNSNYFHNYNNNTTNSGKTLFDVMHYNQVEYIENDKNSEIKSIDK